MHTIRLRAAWERLPSHTWRRRFNTPTGLGPDDRVFFAVDVFLAIDSPTGDAGLANLSLNGVGLDPADGPRWSIADRLSRTGGNVLQVELSGTAHDEAILASSRLEIESAD